jgi:hypothetical protein
MIQSILTGLLILSTSTSNPSCIIGLSVESENEAVYSVADNQKGDDDPGKAITDDPHGPGTRGANPHGPDPHDEIHDKNLPANNPSPYLDPQNSSLDQ